MTALRDFRASISVRERGRGASPTRDHLTEINQDDPHRIADERPELDSGRRTSLASRNGVARQW
jgi:hypothetical protein